MKKALTIGGIIGFLLISALAISIFFPGLPTYLKVKLKYEHIDERIPEFEKSDIPGDYVSHTLRGVRFSTPSDWEAYSPIEGAEPNAYRAKDKSTVFVLNLNYKAQEELLKNSEETLGSEYDVWNEYEFSEEDYRHFYKAIGIEPQQYGLNLRMLWYMRDDVTAKDCLKLRGRDRKVFLDVADSKDESVKMETMWKTKGKCFYAYIGRIMYSGFDGNTWTVNIFPDGNENEHFTTTIKCSDETTTRKIISSIELE